MLTLEHLPAFLLVQEVRAHPLVPWTLYRPTEYVRFKIFYTWQALLSTAIPFSPSRPSSPTGPGGPVGPYWNTNTTRHSTQTVGIRCKREQFTRIPGTPSRPISPGRPSTPYIGNVTAIIAIETMWLTFSPLVPLLPFVPFNPSLPGIPRSPYQSQNSNINPHPPPPGCMYAVFFVDKPSVQVNPALQ